MRFLDALTLGIVARLALLVDLVAIAAVAAHVGCDEAGRGCHHQHDTAPDSATEAAVSHRGR